VRFLEGVDAQLTDPVPDLDVSALGGRHKHVGIGTPLHLDKYIITRVYNREVVHSQVIYVSVVQGSV
jgi:hypothetical protein